jgi:hypothetical protein
VEGRGRHLQSVWGFRFSPEWDWGFNPNGIGVFNPNGIGVFNPNGIRVFHPNKLPDAFRAWTNANFVPFQGLLMFTIPQTMDRNERRDEILDSMGVEVRVRQSIAII